MGSASSSLPPPLAILRPLSLVLASALTLQGALVSIIPAPLLQNYGLAPAPHLNTPLVPVMASRNLTIGITMVIFSYVQNDFATGVMMITGCIAPLVDSFVCEKWGKKGSSASHIMGSVICSSVGAGLLYYGKY